MLPTRTPNTLAQTNSVIFEFSLAKRGVPYILDKSFSEWLRKFVKGELLEVWQINELTTLVIIGTFSLD